MKLLVKSAVFVVLISASSLVYGQNTIWRNTTSDTTFENAANWNNGFPGPGFSAFVVPDGIGDPTGLFLVTKGGNLNITINATTDQTSANFFVTNDVGDTLTPGTVSLTFAPGKTYTLTGDLGVSQAETLTYSGNLVVGGAVNVGDALGGTFNLISGSLDNSTGSGLVIGSGAGKAGVFNQGVLNGTAANVTANNVAIGTNGTGSYTLNSSSIFQSGGAGATIVVGQGVSSSGTLTLNNSSQVNLSSGSDVRIGTGAAGATGTVTQTGPTTQLNLAGTSSMEIGNGTGNVGVYNLESGQLNIGATGADATSVDIGIGAANMTNTAGTGSLIQSGGTLTAMAGTTFTVGNNGIGTYQLSNGTADFQNGFVVGNQVGSIGTVIQQSGTLTAENTAVTIGGGGAGTYMMEGGNATFSAGVVVGAIGSIVQTGGTFIVPVGQTLDLSAAGSSYSLNGGVLQIGNDGAINGIVGTTGQGTFNFGGGTLQVAAGSAATTVEALNGTVVGSNTLDTTNGNITLSGSLTDGPGAGGRGSFTIIGGGSVNFINGNNSAATWGLNIANGAVNATAAFLPASGGIVIGSGGAGSTGVLNLNAAGTNEFTGNITSAGNSGTGIFNVNFGGAGDVLELAGTGNNFTGTTNLVGGGTVQVFTGTYGNIAGNGALEIGGDATVANTGTVALTGINTYTGQTLINSGFTVMAADTVVGGVTTHDAFNGSVTNQGTLVPTTALPATINTPTLSINGALNSSGTLVVRLNGIVADQYAVAGVATLSGNVKIVNGSGTGSYIILTATGGETGGNTLTTNAPTTLFSSTITTTGTEVILNTVQAPLLGFAKTPNQQAVAQALNPLTQTPPPAFAHILGSLNNLSAAAIPQALAELTPESLQYARNIAFQNTDFLVLRMNGVDADLRAGYGGLDTNAISIVNPAFNSSMGRSLGSLLASDSGFHPTAPNGVNYYPGDDSSSAEISDSSATPFSPASSKASKSSGLWNPGTQVAPESSNPYLATHDPNNAAAPRTSEFISGDVVLADLNTDQSQSNAPSSKAHYTAGDVTAGVSYRMASNLAAGVLFNYDHTDAQTDVNGSSTKVDSYSPGLFATYFDHGFYVNGLASFGYNNYRNSRDISFAGERATSSPDGQQYVGALDFGYDFHPDKSWVLGPTLGLTYTHLDVDSFQEEGAPGANLAVDSQSADSLRSRLGGHLVYQTMAGNILLQSSLMAMWQHEFLDDSSAITSSFTDFNANSFNTQTAAPSRDSALIGCGVTATLNSTMAFYLNYLVDVGASDYFAQSVYGGIKARF